MFREITYIICFLISLQGYSQSFSKELENSLINFIEDENIDSMRYYLSYLESNNQTKNEAYYGLNALIKKDSARKVKNIFSSYKLYQQSIFYFKESLSNGNINSYFYQKSNYELQVVFNMLYNDAIKAFQIGDFTNSLKFNELAYDIGINDKDKLIDLLINSSLASTKLGDVDKSIFFNKEILKLNSNDIDSYIELILLNDQKRDVDEAFKYVNIALKKFPKEIEFYSEKARLTIKYKNYREAIAALEELLKIDRENTVALNSVAQIYDYNIEYKKAIKFYNKTLKLDPLNLDANYNLGSIYFNKGVDFNNQLLQTSLTNYVKSQKLNRKSTKNFNKCIPYYEKAYPQLSDAEKQQLKPSLMKAYIKVGRDEDADKL